MTSWLILLGKRNSLYKAMAREHSLVMIGYSIDKNLTKKDEKEIRKYLECQGKDSWHVNHETVWISDFVKGIKPGDTIISPSWGDPNNYRVGNVVGKCHTIRCFFWYKFWKLNPFLEKHPPDNKNDNPKIKPARKVKWEDGERKVDDLPAELQKEFKELGRNNTPTVNRLKFDYEKPEDNKLQKISMWSTIIGAPIGIIAIIVAILLGVYF